MNKFEKLKHAKNIVSAKLNDSIQYTKKQTKKTLESADEFRKSKKVQDFQDSLKEKSKKVINTTVIKENSKEIEHITQVCQQINNINEVLTNKNLSIASPEFSQLQKILLKTSPNLFTAPTAGATILFAGNGLSASVITSGLASIGLGISMVTGVAVIGTSAIIISTIGSKQYNKWQKKTLVKKKNDLEIILKSKVYDLETEISETQNKERIILLSSYLVQVKELLRTLYQDHSSSSSPKDSKS